MRKTFAFGLLILFSIFCTKAQAWIHPGLLHTSEAIERMRGYIATETKPAYSSFQKLKEQTDADYQMAGPWETIARDGEHRNTKDGNERDFNAAYRCALMWCLTDEEAYANKAMEIVRAYSAALRHIDGHDAPLMAGLNGFIFVNACELLRYTYPKWTDEDTQEVEHCLRSAFLPVLEEFERQSPYANGNWGAIVNKMRLATGVFLCDTALVSHAVDYYLNAYDNGSLPHYIAPSGQCQELGRDQAHAMLGVITLAETCEVAWSQGIDLYGALENRLMAGVEYAARANLGYEVPFERWDDLTGLYCNWNELGTKALGQWRPGFELPYNHYVGRKGLSMPYTSAVLHDYLRPEGAGPGNDDVGFGSLFFYNGTKVNQLKNKPAKRKDGGYEAKLLAYPAPAEGAPLMRDYRVEVKPDGGDWTQVPTYMAKANVGVGNNRHEVHEYSYAYFDFTGNVSVRVTLLGGKTYKRVEARPLYHGIITNVVNDSTVTFSLFQPENVSVEFDGDITNNLLLFTSVPPVSKEQAQKEAKKAGREFIYFPAGYHLLSDSLLVPSGTTVYLEGGAYIDGQILLKDVDDVTVCGRGVVRPTEGREGMRVSRCHNVVVDGVITTQCPVGESSDVTIREVRSLTHYGWGDGLNVFASSHVLFDRVFCRTSDDCTTVYATRLGYKGSSSDVTMQNSTLWADVAHPIFIGLHGNSQQPDSMVNLTYRNIDILCQSEPQLDYQGCLSINAGDNNLVSHVLFDNIRIESLHQGSLLQLRIFYNPKYCTAPGRGISDVTFHLIRYTGARPEPSLIMGYNEERKVSDIRFQDLRINDLRITDDMEGKPAWYKTADMARFFVGDFVENLSFEK